MEFKFTKKPLMIVAGIICAISILLIPLAIVLFIAASKGKIVINDNEFIYSMVGTTKIPLKDITKLTLKNAVRPGQQIPIGNAGMIVNITTVQPLEIQYSGKKKTFTLNAFETPNKIVEMLEKKTGLKLA